MAIDSAGREQTIHVYTNLVSAAEQSDSNATVDNTEELRFNGKRLIRITKGEYQVIDTSEIFRSSSPDAF